MPSKRPAMFTSFVVDCNLKWKIRCRSDNNLIMRFQAAKAFCEDLKKVDFDRVVVYETGEVLEGDTVFEKYRNYMYLKPNEEYTYDPDFDLEKMPLGKPPPPVLPKQRERPTLSAKILEIYRYLAVDKRYEDDKYWTYDEATLKEISSHRTTELHPKLDQYIEDRGAIGSIMLTALQKRMEMAQERAIEKGYI